MNTVKKYLRYFAHSVYPVGQTVAAFGCIYGMIECFKSVSTSTGMHAVGDFIVGTIMLCGAVTILTVLGWFWVDGEEREINDI